MQASPQMTAMPIPVSTMTGSNSSIHSSNNLDSNSNIQIYPQRVGEQDCRDYLRTGRCKYGESCKVSSVEW